MSHREEEEAAVEEEEEDDDAATHFNKINIFLLQLFSAIQLQST